ncbi:hypothetical protein [Bacillus sp. FJAT-45037]|uniref:hypothetical protein n=1 Tax=Bacillus sp. FJAT-45037 TaxID=2011007 RepID=UPI000C23E337|nr:hypothetical protein [Bacillus sp. FJAT-45037]
MTQISRTNSLRANRIHTSFVNRMTNASGVHPIEPIDRSVSIKNPTQHPTEHQITYYDYYYEKQSNKNKSKYKNAKESHEELTNEYQQTVEKLIRSYNQLVLSFKHIDQRTCESNTKKLHEVYTKYSEYFESIGVVEQSNNLLTSTNKTYDNTDHSQMNSDILASFMQDVLSEYRLMIDTSSAHKTNPYEQDPPHETGLMFEERL